VIADGTNRFYGTRIFISTNCCMGNGQAFRQSDKEDWEKMKIDMIFTFDANKAITVKKMFDGFDIQHENLTLTLTEEQLQELQYEINKALKTPDVEDLQNTIEELEGIIEEQKEQFKELTEIAESKGLSI
jgi:peptidoglycan hydrolase CwlO-like protein